MKILSPAGNFECLKMAIFNGADEVYLGINDFNARNNIDGFSLSSIKEAVDFAHVFQVKVCLAINILFSNDEIQNALDVIVDVYNLGVDAFIIQDLGLAKLVSENYSQIEIHASTQMGIHNLEGVLALEKFGFKRVVLARETPLDEIKRIKQNCNIEIEYFAQGALCVSFSGNCYLSSYLCNASGNRGKCKQLCRLPYVFEKDGKKIKEGYLLSAKDFNMANRLKDLQEAGVDVIKIEGRARRPFYVATATREYYNALHGQNVNQDNLKLAFNRNFCEGYFNGNAGIISNFHNHVGIKIGKVEKFVKGKNFNEIYLSSKRELHPKSTFKFFDKQEIVLTAYDIKKVQNNLYKITTTQVVNVGSVANLIVDANAEESVLSAIKKRPVLIEIFAEKDKAIRAVFEVEGVKFEVEGDVCQQAQKQPISQQDFASNFAKNDIFDARVKICALDKVFMTKQKLNDFRRKVFDKVFQVLTKSKHAPIDKIKVVSDYKVKKFDNFEVIEKQTENISQANVIYSPEIYDIEDISIFKEKCESQGKEFYLDTPNFALKKDIEHLQNIITKTGTNIVANNYYALTLNTKIVIGAGLNVYNKFSAEVLDNPVITAESDISTKIDFAYMTLRHCPMKNHLSADCNACPYQEGYVFKMKNGKQLKLKRKKLSTCTFYLTH